VTLARRTFINMASNAAGALVPLFVTLWTTPLVIRLLGENGYGLQNLAGAIAIFLGFLNMGVDVPIAKFLAQYNSLKDDQGITRLLDTMMTICLLAGGTGLLATVLFSQTLAMRAFHLTAQDSVEARIVFILAGVSFLIGQVQSWGNACLVGLERFDRSNLIQVPTAILSPLAGILAIITGCGVTGFVAARIAVTGLGTAFTIREVASLLPNYRVHLRVHWPTLRLIAGYLASGVAFRIVGFVTGGLDRTLIAAWISMAAVTAYVVEWSLISPVQSVLGSTFNFLFPMSSALLASGEKTRFHRIFLKSSTVNAALSCVAFGGLLLFGEPFLKLWVGPLIATQVEGVFPWLVIGTLLAQLSGSLFNSVVVGSGQLRLFFVYTICRAALLSGALVIGVRHFSLSGAGFAYAAAGLLEVAYLFVCVRWILHVPFIRFLRLTYAKPILVATLLTAATWPIRQLASTWVRLLLLGSLFCICAAIGIVVARIIDREDLARVRHFVRERWSRTVSDR
jgi:O-antigen/teichoic acid export membrane protein